MIRSFGDKDTKILWETGKSKKFSKEIIKNALKKLSVLNNAKSLNDLSIFPSYRLHKLEGSDYHSISINMQWRIIFIWVGKNATFVKISKHYEN